jgi:RNA polymerase sigma-70 factor (ECF subfamily)
MTDVDDAGLVGRARQGDEDAFAELFGRYQRPVYRYAAHMCGHAAADDVVQETFLAILQQRDRPDLPHGPALGYLMGIARHRIWKRLARMGEVVVPLDDETATRVGATPDLDALASLAHAELVAAVRQAVRALPAPYREVVVLCELEELNYAEAARAMECPIGTVRSRLHRARALLAAKLTAMSVTEMAGVKGND